MYTCTQKTYVQNASFGSWYLPLQMWGCCWCCWYSCIHTSFPKYLLHSLVVQTDTFPYCSLLAVLLFGFCIQRAPLSLPACWFVFLYLSDEIPFSFRFIDFLISFLELLLISFNNQNPINFQPATWLLCQLSGSQKCKVLTWLTLKAGWKAESYSKICLDTSVENKITWTLDAI